MKKTILLLTALAGIGVPSVRAGHVGESGEDGSHNDHKHHVAVFLGGTHDYHGENAFTVGVDYEFRLNDLFGIAALVDYAGGDIDATVVGGGLFIHPWQDLRLLAALGNEHHGGHNELLVRLGTMYDFHIESWSLSPTLHVDLLEGGHQNWIYGVALGRAF